MLKRTIGLSLALLLCLLLTLSAFADKGWGFSDYDGFSETSTQYWFSIDHSLLVFSKEVNDDFDYKDSIYSGSDLFVPVFACDYALDDPEERIATEKQIKDDNVKLSYKVLQGSTYVDNVSLVSGKKEKLKGLPAGMYAKIEFADTYLPLLKNRVQIRLVLSVNGVSYQEASATYSCYIYNRSETISKNSVYGALVPTQFKVTGRYKGEATFDFGDDIRYTSKVAPNERYYLNLDRTVDPAMKDTYKGAYLEAYDFKGTHDTFAEVGTLEIPINKAKFKEKKTSAQVYAYAVEKNTLTALTGKQISYNPKTGKVSIKTKTLGTYILSSRALMQSVPDSKEEDILRFGYASDPNDEPGITKK